MKNKMKRTIVIITILLVALAGAATGNANRKGGESASKVSKPLEYAGYSRAEYKSHKKWSVYVPARDGTKLAVDVYLPAEGPDRKSFPVIFQFLPYTRAFAYPHEPFYMKIALKMMLGTSGPIVDMYSLEKAVPPLLSHGYAYVIADMRGTGASFGTAFHPIPENFTDVEDLLKWIAGQKWCDGNIGMFGGSYLGYIQFVAASRQVKELKCIAPEVAPLGFSDLAYRGGIYSQEFLKDWSDVATLLNENMFIPKKHYPLPLVLPAVPVVDEDGDGDLLDEIPVYNKEGTFLAGPPRYKDGQPRAGIYYKATLEHKKNVAFQSWVGEINFAGGDFPPPYSSLKISDILVHSFMPKIMETRIPIYNLGGWHDANVRGTTETFCSMRKTNPSKMLIGAGYHTGTGPYWAYSHENEKKVMEKFGTELLRFFDRYLKGVQNGIENEPPIYIYVQNGDGGHWRFENEWPLARQKITDFFFDGSHKLSAKREADGFDKYMVDFHHDSRYGTHLGNRYLAAAGVETDKLPIRTEKDKTLLTYTSAPVAQNTEVTGHPIVDLWVSSSAENGDFYVYLEDVDQSGVAVLVSEGQLMAGFAKLVDNNKMGTGGVAILPKLPWHGYTKDDFVDNILAGGRIVNLVLDLMPTSWVFRKGHSIRISIACADWPTFRLNPKLSPANKPDDPKNIRPVVSVYHDADHQSKIMLPVIPEL